MNFQSWVLVVAAVTVAAVLAVIAVAVAVAVAVAGDGVSGGVLVHRIVRECRVSMRSPAETYQTNAHELYGLKKRQSMCRMLEKHG